MIKKFDCMLHLAGEQTLPIYIGLMQFECPFHVIAVTEKTHFVGEIIQGQVPRGVTVELVNLPPYNIVQSSGILQEMQLKAGSKKWCFNLTGGTKPMFAAALQVAQKTSSNAFYVETSNKSLDWLLPSMETKENLKPVVDQVGTFIHLAGYDANVDFANQMALSAENKHGVVNECWKQRRLLAKSYREMSNHGRYPGVPFKYNQGFRAELSGPEKSYEGMLQIGKNSWQFQPWMDLAQFISGGWFECFVWFQTESLIREGLIKDRLFRISPVENKSDGANHVQEFDVAVTDGFYLSIIEVKAGEVKQDHIQKLENLSRRFGGHFGRGVLVFADKDKIDKNTIKRIKDSDLVCAVSGECVSRNPGCLLKAMPGEFLL